MNGPDNLLDPPSEPIETVALPQVQNRTAYPSQYFQMMDAADQIYHVMVSRVTYDLTRLDEAGYPAIAATQTPLVEADEYYEVLAAEEEHSGVVAGEHPLPHAKAGALTTRSVKQESDFAPYKPKCDVLFVNAHAYSPRGGSHLVDQAKAYDRYPAGVKIEFLKESEKGSETEIWVKTLQVTGSRYLKEGLTGWSITEAKPTRKVPIRYELAYGGTNHWWPEWDKRPDLSFEQIQNEKAQQTASAGDATEAEPEINVTHRGNPVGRGYANKYWCDKLRKHIKRYPAPQIEAFDEKYTASHASNATAAAHKRPSKAEAVYPVVGLGVIGRWWSPRREKAGTYDQRWKETRWPRLPEDFDFEYWNCAPEDQQFDYFKGGERITLANLTPSLKMWFCVPKLDLKLQLGLEAGIPLFKAMNLDTVIVDLEAMRLSLVYRGVVSAQAGVKTLELGSWDIAAARARNAKLAETDPKVKALLERSGLLTIPNV